MPTFNSISSEKNRDYKFNLYSFFSILPWLHLEGFMYMFVYCIYTWYIDAHNHQGLNPKTSLRHTKVLTTKHFKTLLTKKKFFKVYYVWHGIL